MSPPENDENFVKLSDSQIPSILSITFKLTDYVNQLWSFFVIVSSALIGWRFTAKESWAFEQQVIVTLIYIIFVIIDFFALSKTYKWLRITVLDLNKAARSLDTQTPEIKKLFSEIAIAGGIYLPFIIYFISASLVIFTIWFLKI